MPSEKVVAIRRSVPADTPADELSGLALGAAESPAALGELVEALERNAQLRALAGRLARSLTSHGPDDLLQSTLERVVRGIRSFRGSGDLLGWVGRIMRNAHIELLRREAREGAKTAALRLERREDREVDPAEALDERELHRCVLDAWRRTSADADVRLFWDRVYVGLSVEQLMRRTGRPRSTVYLMLQRGGAKFAREVRRLLG